MSCHHRPNELSNTQAVDIYMAKYALASVFLTVCVLEVKHTSVWAGRTSTCRMGNADVNRVRPLGTALLKPGTAWQGSYQLTWLKCPWPMAAFNANGWRGLPQLHEFSHPAESELDWHQEITTHGTSLKATMSQHVAWRKFQQNDIDGWCHRKRNQMKHVLTFTPNSISAGHVAAARPSSSTRNRSKSWAGMTDWQRAVLCHQRREQEAAGEVYLLTVCWGLDGSPVLDAGKTVLGKQASGLCQVFEMSVRLADAWSTWLQVILWLEEVTNIPRADMRVQYIINPRKAAATTASFKPPYWAYRYCPLVACFGQDLMPVLQLVQLCHSRKDRAVFWKAEDKRIRAAGGEGMDTQGYEVVEAPAGGYRYSAQDHRRATADAFRPGCWPNLRRDGWWLAPAWQWGGTAHELCA